MPSPKGNVPKRRGVYGWSLLNHIRYMAQKPLYYKAPPYYAAMLSVPPSQGPYRQKQKGKLFFDEDRLRARLEPKSLWVRRDWRKGNLGVWSYGLNDGGTAIKRIKSLMAQGYSENDALKIFETEQINQFKRKKKQIEWVTEEEGFTYRDGIEVLKLLKQVNKVNKQDLIQHIDEFKENKERNFAIKGASVQNPQLIKTLSYLNKVNEIALRICSARKKLTDVPVYTKLGEENVVSPIDLFSIYIYAFNVSGENEKFEEYKVPYYNGKNSTVYMDKLYDQFRNTMAEYMKFSPSLLERSMLKTLEESNLIKDEDKEDARSFILFEKAGITPPDFTRVFKMFSEFNWPQFDEKMGHFRNRFEFFYAFIKFQEVLGMDLSQTSPELFLDNITLFKQTASQLLHGATSSINSIGRLEENYIVNRATQDLEWSNFHDKSVPEGSKQIYPIEDFVKFLAGRNQL